MANALFDSARQLFLEGALNWKTDPIYVALIDTNKIQVNLAAHTQYSTYQAAVVGSPVQLTNKKTDGGAADADDVTFQSVSGDSVEALLLYKQGVPETNGNLIAWIDTATGLPITPNGGDIIVTWDNGNNKIFKL